MGRHFKRAAKAYVAAAIAACSYLAGVVDDGIAASEALTTVGAALAAWQGVYWTPNAARVVRRITGSLR